MVDLHGTAPVVEIAPAVTLVDGLNGVSLMLLEGERALSPLLGRAGAELLEPEPAGIPGGGSFVPRGLAGNDLLVW